MEEKAKSAIIELLKNIQAISFKIKELPEV